jgi:two-component system cell cycle response regulator DivK
MACPSTKLIARELTPVKRGSPKYISKRILVVEDQADNRQIIRDMLASTDYEIMEAEGAEQALAAVAKERPDLILMGVQLPIMDGYEVARQIKANPAMRSIPIIAITSHALDGKKRQRERQDVMPMCRSLSVPAACWRRFINS